MLVHDLVRGRDHLLAQDGGLHSDEPGVTQGLLEFGRRERIHGGDMFARKQGHDLALACKQLFHARKVASDLVAEAGALHDTGAALHAALLDDLDPVVDDTQRVGRAVPHARPASCAVKACLHDERVARYDYPGRPRLFVHLHQRPPERRHLLIVTRWDGFA